MVALAVVKEMVWMGTTVLLVTLITMDYSPENEASQKPLLASTPRSFLSFRRLTLTVISAS